jgi:hypothetical protein
MTISSHEKTQYTLAIVCSALVACGLFAALWTAIGSTGNLSVITCGSNLLGVGFFFLARRRLSTVMSNGRAHFASIQFGFSLLLALLVVVFFVNALYVQGVPPILGQVLGLGLVAAAVLVSAEGSDANATDQYPRSPRVARHSSARSALFPAAVFVASLLVFDFVWGSRFYTDLSHVGHDFSLSALALLEGKFWFDSNGIMAGLFNPPWFTPAWCAGTAFYADPQAAFYSPLQAAALWFDPFFASYLNVLMYAAVAYWGSYAVAHRVLGWQAAGAVVFAVLGMANAFTPMRSAVGELGYQPLFLWTMLALALCWPSKKSSWRSEMWPIAMVCLCLTAWLQFAFAGMMVPVFLGTALFCFVVVLLGRADIWLIVSRSFAGAILAIILNASKLYESASLMRQFPRDFYELPGFTSLTDALLSIPYALLRPSEWTAEFGLRKLSNVRFTALPHEWAMHFGLGAVALALLSGLLVFLLQRGKSFLAIRRLRPSEWAAAIGIVLIGLVPIALLWEQGSIREAIKRIPILNSAAWPMRWIVIYIPVVQWLLAIPVVMLLARIGQRRLASVFVLVATAIVWCGPATENVAYYIDPGMQSYDPKPVMRAFRASQLKGPIAISNIDVAAPEHRGLNRNDTMLGGASQAACYNPIYGYRLEAFPQKERLRSGGALDTDSNAQTLLINPACLVHPRENQCRPGDGFRLDAAGQPSNAQLFLGRHPFAWNRPWLGQILSVVSQTVFWLLFAALVMRCRRAAISMIAQYRSPSLEQTAGKVAGN